MQQRPLLLSLTYPILVRVDTAELQLLPSRITAVLKGVSSDAISERSDALHERPIVLSVPAQFRRVGLGIRMLIEGKALAGQASKADPKLVKLIARAHHFSNELAASSAERLADVAQAAGLTSSYFTRVLRLTDLAPDITWATIEGRHPRDLTRQKLLAHSRLPLAWPDQRRLLGFI
jgi:site-specific DNA recombinase